MVLLKSIVEVATRSMSHLAAKLKPDRSGIGVMAICRDPVRRDAGYHLGRSKIALECFTPIRHVPPGGTARFPKSPGVTNRSAHDRCALARTFAHQFSR